MTPLRGVLKSNEPMAKHVSWRAGGAAARAYWPADRDDLIAFLKLQRDDEPIHFVGLGSNLLVRDGGVKGTVVFLHGLLNGIEERPHADGVTRIFAEAGVASPKVARHAARASLEGAEFLAGVPGTVGGALAMNAGCYGSETWVYVESVTTVDRGGMVRERFPADYDIGYRHVALKPPSALRLPPPEEWFIAATFKFRPGSEAVAKARITEWLKRRVATQPLGQPNAGSTFRNPAGDHSGRLVEACGLKGYTVGGAQVSEKHANFVVNLGGAKAADIEAVVRHMHDTVLAKTGVDLVQEVRVIGDAKVGN
ncbi:MAG: UDP-N-acetylmuramate dehydrogenase [Betaproteobacteria bacterium]|nr:UDP-N-acetylmuramate dehydrogenase [Betaproteobacteria bacterium]